MQLFYDLLPIIVFFVIYKILGVYFATGAAIITSILQVIIYRLRFKTYEKMQVITLILIMVMGGATLLLHNPIFIKWKPTVINWLFGSVFLVSHFLGKKPLLRYVMDKKITLPNSVWKKLSFSWIGFFFVMGFINLYVIYHFDTNTWVNFKLFGMLGLTFAFVILQAIFLARYLPEESIKK